MKVVDLFCGAGGFSLGFQQAGFEVILGVDILPIALKTHAHNISGDVLCADVRELKAEDIPDCDVLIGSPPCPDFSIANISAGKNRRQPDLSMIEKFMELVEIKKPRFWIWENVPSAKKYIHFLPHAILDAQNHGVPQRRKRLFVGSYIIPDEVQNEEAIAPTICAWELSGGFRTTHTRRFSKWIGRKPTIDEMKYYMGFPKDFEVFGTQHEKGMQIGNAVCPPVAKAIAKKIKERM